VKIAEEARDILRGCMYRRSNPIAWGILLVALVLLLAVTLAASTVGLRDKSGSIAIPPRQDVTPTAVEEPVSQAGTTDGIWWLGLGIVAIVLLPVITRRIFWS